MPIEIDEPDPRWPAQFEEIASVLREEFGDTAVSIDHIGSTAVPGLPAKPIIDVQVTVLDFDGVREHLEASGLEMADFTHDHQPPGLDLPAEQLEKRTAFSRAGDIQCNVHVRVAGRYNQRYALLFRDYLRSNRAAAQAYAAIKHALADLVGDDRDAYYAVKDPVCDLIMAAAELWATNNGWLHQIDR